MASFFKTILYIPFYNLMIFFAFLAHGSIGWAIIFVTLVIRAALWWPSIKAAKATTAMQALQPKINAIREKYKDDTQKLNEETMKLYKEAGASPLGCCGPMVIQLVVIWILYRVFFIGFNTNSYNLLYAFTPRPETIKTFFMGIDLSKPEHWVLPILAGATQMLLSWMTMPKTDPKQKADINTMMSKQMTFIFPIMTIFIARNLASGLALYWVVTTLFSLGQQYYVNKVIRKDLQATAVDIKEIVQPKTEKPSGVMPEKPKKDPSQYLSKVMNNKLDKQDKKKGVEITIRKK